MERESMRGGALDTSAPGDRLDSLREHYVPIRRTDLLNLLCAERGMDEQDAKDFRSLADLLCATFHFQYLESLEQLLDAYAHFNPDTDSPPLEPLSESQQEACLERFFQELNWILARANFRRLSREDIEAVLGRASAWGLNLDVDFSCFDRLEIYTRGAVTGRRSLRRLRNFLRPEELDVPIYQRLCVVFRLAEHERLGEDADTRSLFLKMFKDIPRIDIEMLLPGTRVKMTPLDKLRIFVPAVGGVLLAAYKMVWGAVGLAAMSLLRSVAFLGFVSGSVGYGFRSFYGYLSTKQKYQLSLTRSLYFQNLGTNAGVLTRLLNEAEAQECREAILGYFLLWKRAGDRGLTVKELNDRAEAVIERVTGRDVDYDVEDALRKFRQLRLIEELPDDRIRAIPITRALEVLDESWNDYFQYTQALPASVRRSAGADGGAPS
jgi:hypothetical protein